MFQKVFPNNHVELFGQNTDLRTAIRRVARVREVSDREYPTMEMSRKAV